MLKMNNKGCQEDLLSFADLKLVGLNLICIFETLYDRDKYNSNDDMIQIMIVMIFVIFCKNLCVFE